MQNAKIGIFLRDRDYADSLAESLARESRQMCYTVCQSDEIKDFDVVISDTDLGIENQLILINSTDQEGCRHKYSIFKYTNASEIMKEISLVIFELTGKVMNYRKSEDMSIVSIISETGGSGTSEIALGICKSLNDVYEKRCIYVNLTSFNPQVLSKSYEGETFKKLMYYLKYKSRFPFECFVKSSVSFDYLLREDVCLYTHEFTAEMMTALRNAAKNSSKWSYLVVDIGNQLTYEKQEIINNSDYIIYVRDMRRNLGSCKEQYYGQLNRGDGQGLILVANYANFDVELGEEWLDLQHYEDIESSIDFQMKMSILGKKVGGEFESK